MTAIETMTRAPASKPLSLAQKRKLAMMEIAPLALSEELSRDRLLIAIGHALGLKPDRATLDKVRNECVIGRVAFRLEGDMVARLDKARELVLHYAPYAKDPKHELPKDKKGRRSEDQERAYVAAKVHFSRLLADVGEKFPKLKAHLASQGTGQAQTGAAMNKEQAAKKRNPAPQPAGSTAKGKASDAPTPASLQAVLVSPAKDMTADDADNHILTTLAALNRMVNKYADKVSGELAAIVIEANRKACKAAGEIAERKAQAKAQSEERRAELAAAGAKLAQAKGRRRK